jgi:hypothetical protein
MVGQRLVLRVYALPFMISDGSESDQKLSLEQWIQRYAPRCTPWFVDRPLSDVYSHLSKGETDYVLVHSPAQISTDSATVRDFVQRCAELGARVVYTSRLI